MRKTIVNIINDTCAGNEAALTGLVDYLKHEKGYTLFRMASIAQRHFRIPFFVALRTLARVNSF